MAVDDDSTVFRALYPRLRRLAAVAGPAEADPDDLVQEALVRTLRTARLKDLDDPAAYLRRAIVNLAANERRRLGRQRRALARVAPASEEGPVAYPSDVVDLLRLAPVARAVLYLSEVERMPFAEVGEAVGLSEEAARAQASRARRRLRRLLDEEERA